MTTGTPSPTVECFMFDSSYSTVRKKEKKDTYLTVLGVFVPTECVCVRLCTGGLVLVGGNKWQTTRECDDDGCGGGCWRTLKKKTVRR